MRIFLMGKILPFPVTLMLVIQLQAVQKASAQEVLDRYIRESLSANLVLQNKSIGLEKSLLALKEARSLYLPTTWFDGTYTVAQGGRSINVPVGDLLNPVYQTLNQLTGTDKFPAISNSSEQLLPNNFYDLRIKTTMPIINSDLRYNRKIREQDIRMKENDILQYKRELVKEIKTAYYSILMAEQAISIYREALTVVNQNLKLNQSLLANGKSLPAYVSRAESEVKMVETQLRNAENDKRRSVAYFNVLLNREISAGVELEDQALIPFTMNETVSQDHVAGREELKGLRISKEMQTQVFRMNKSFRNPRLNAFLDLAAQDFNFRVNSRSFFYMGGLQVNIPLFAGNRNLYKIKQSELDLKQLDITTTYTRNQLELAAFNSRSNAANSYGNYIASLKQEESAGAYFRLIDRGYREGINSYIEFLDARNQYTQSRLQSAINKYRYLAAMADYERQTSSYTIN